VSGRSHDRQRAVFMSASGQLRGRLRAVSRGRCHSFIGLAPDAAEPIGIELDPTTAAIATALYPHPDIRTESFAETRLPEGYADLMIGNVPFGTMALNDRRHNPRGHTIHNHFLIKRLHLTRPGGLAVAITSRYTMDSTNPAARRELGELADLVFAVRLPEQTHQLAGTQVVTDLLVLRRRTPGADPAGPPGSGSGSLPTSSAWHPTPAGPWITRRLMRCRRIPTPLLQAVVRRVRLGPSAREP